MRLDDRRAGPGPRGLSLIPLLTAAVLAVTASPALHAAPLSPADLTALCIEAEDAAHCGRLVEARQLKRLGKTLATILERDGDVLRVSLVPFGLVEFRDTVNVRMRSYAIWDYVEDLDTLVLFTTHDDRSGFMLVQRRGGAEYALPAEPVFSPDLRHFVTVDVCPRQCDHEVAVWRIGSDGVAREAVWRPPADWTDASASWRGDGRLALDYSTQGEQASRTIERRLADPSWQRPAAK